MELQPRSRALTGLLALLVAAAVGSALGVRPPAPSPAGAPAEQFSAARAQVHLERIAGEPRPIGSPAAAEVRASLESVLTGLGLELESQEAVGSTGSDREYFAAAPVHNVVAVLPGTDPTGRVFLAAHHDTQPLTPGAADDGAGVAALLETARALAQGPRPRNDVVFVLTDAEETFLLGAEAFVGRHPLAADGGVLLNLEARGNAGPVITHSTTPGGAPLVALFDDVVPHPSPPASRGSSTNGWPTTRTSGPSPTTAGSPGGTVPTSTGPLPTTGPRTAPGHWIRGRCSTTGATPWPWRALGDADVPDLTDRTGADATHFPVRGRLGRYPAALTWPLAALTTVIAVVAAVVTLRRGAATGPRAVAGLGTAAVPLAAAPLLAHGLWLLLVALRPGYAQMLDPWRPGWTRAALPALVAAVVLAWYALLRRRIGAGGLHLGALGALTTTGLVLAAVAPGAAHPAILPAVGAGLAVLAAVTAGTAAVASVLGGAVAVLVLGPAVVLVLPALGLAGVWSTALLAVLLVLVPVPDAARPDTVRPGTVGQDTTGQVAAGRDAVRPGGAPSVREAVPALVATALAVACVVTGLAVDRFDPSHPAPSHLAYALDADTGRARWVGAGRRPGDRSASYVTAREDLARSFPVLGGDLATGPARAAALPAPRLRVESDRTVLLRIEPRRTVHSVHVGVPDGTVLGAELMGREAETRGERGRFEAWFSAPPPEGVTLRLVLAGGDPVPVRVLDVSHGLDGMPDYRPRPPGAGPDGDLTADAGSGGRRGAGAARGRGPAPPRGRSRLPGGLRSGGGPGRWPRGAGPGARWWRAPGTRRGCPRWSRRRR